MPAFPPEQKCATLPERAVLPDAARSPAAGRWGSGVYIACLDDGGFGDGGERPREPAALLTLDNDVVSWEAGGGCCPWQSGTGCLPAGARLQCEASLRLAKRHCHGHR